MRVLLPLKKNKGAYQEDEEGILEEEERIAFSGSGVAVAAVAPCQEEAPSPPASPVARKPDSPVQFEPTKKRARTEYTFSAEADNEKPPAVSQNSESIMAGGRRAYGQDDEQEEVREDWSGAGSLRVVSRLETEPATPLENEAPVYNDANSNRSNVARLSSPVAAAAAAASHAETPQSTKPSNDTANVEINLTAFTQALKNRGLEMVPQEGDGNCLFRAVSLQVYGDSSNHADVRTQCLDFMARDPQHFGPFVTTDEAFSEYIARKRLDGVHGNHAEIQAASELFNRPVEVLGPTGQPLNIFHAEYKTADVPIRLSYHDGNHYNAVIDPLVPTAGLGLGFSDLKPGLADTMQVAKAVQESDQLEDEKELQRVMKASQEDELQRALKESTHSMDSLYQKKTMGLSDLDATNFEVEQKILANSMESYRRQEAGRKQRASPTLGRRRRGRSSPVTERERHLPAFGTSSVAAIPPTAAAAAAAPSVASVASAASASPASPPRMAASADEYPQTVQELVMNGFTLEKVIHAYELIGDNFDDLLNFLMQNQSC